MKTTVSLGICVLCCLVALIAAEAFGYETSNGGDNKHSTVVVPKNEPNLVKSANYGAGANNLLEPVLEYVPGDQAVVGDNERPHDKRDTLSHPISLESLQAKLQEHLRGRRTPFYVDEPRFIVIRRPAAAASGLLPSSSGFSFIPQRGRKSDPSAAAAVAAAASMRKRELSIKQMLEGSDYFVPNRGKKRVGNGISKKVKFDDILGSEELFIPNRGKKELFDLSPFGVGVGGGGGGGGRMLNDIQPLFSKKNVLNAIQNVGSKETMSGNGGELFYPTRGKKNVLDSLAQSQDTFFSSRGRRNPMLWSMLHEADEDLSSPWEYLTFDEAGDDLGVVDRYQTNKIIT